MTRAIALLSIGKIARDQHIPSIAASPDWNLAAAANCTTPVAADLTFFDPGRAAITAGFDWRQEGQQTWDIAVTAKEGALMLSMGGARLAIDGRPVADAPGREYPRLYSRMAALVASGKSDVDLAPMTHVADASTLGQRRVVDNFDW